MACVCVCVCVCVSYSVVSNSVIPWTVARQAALFMEFSRQYTRVGCNYLIQGIFQTNGLNPGILHCRQILYSLSHQACLRLTQFSSVTQLCPTLCDPMDCSMPGLPVHHQLLELIQTHVHRVSDAIQLSHPLPSPSPPTFNSSHHQGLFQ